jgi:hypothetical protein
MLTVLGRAVIGRLQPYPLMPLWGSNSQVCTRANIGWGRRGRFQGFQPCFASCANLWRSNGEYATLLTNLHLIRREAWHLAPPQHRRHLPTNTMPAARDLQGTCKTNPSDCLTRWRA